MTIKVLRCLNFMSQIRTFCRRGYMLPTVWRATRLHFARMLRTRLFVRGWQSLAPFFDADPGFCRYVEREQQGIADARPARASLRATS